MPAGVSSPDPDGDAATIGVDLDAYACSEPLDTDVPGIYLVYYRCTDSHSNFDDRALVVTVVE